MSVTLGLLRQSPFSKPVITSCGDKLIRAPLQWFVLESVLVTVLKIRDVVLNGIWRIKLIKRVLYGKLMRTKEKVKQVGKRYKMVTKNVEIKERSKL